MMIKHRHTYSAVGFLLFLVLMRTALGELVVYDYEIVHTYPHDPQAFTQGLLYHKGFLYESTGLWGQSSLRKVELSTGKVLQKYSLQDQYFAEGITLWEDKIIQLTWRNRQGFTYSLSSLLPLSSFPYFSEGWGITHDGQQLIASDGSHHLYFLDPVTFEVKRQLPIYHQGRPLVKLNELEYIEGEIWANIWEQPYIARISPTTGKVTGWIDCSALVKIHGDSRRKVLNGIAYDAKDKRLFITGKLWSHVFEVRPVPRLTDMSEHIVPPKKSHE